MSLRVDHFRIYCGPNHALPAKAIVFRLGVSATTLDTESLIRAVQDRFPTIDPAPEGIAELFARTLIEVQRLDMELAVSQWAVDRLDENHWEIAVETIDEYSGEDCLHFTQDFFNDALKGREFAFRQEFACLQENFDRGIYGGPTIYSIVEAGFKARIPMFYLHDENAFQWGYGRRQIRGRSTTVSTDSIKDTEFTCYKDMVKRFLDHLGLPTPRGTVCYEISQALHAAHDIGYPLVVKPVSGHKGQGVTTNIRSERELERVFQALLDSGVEGGIIVETHVTGFDHRLLTVGGKFAAALKREPAFVTGDGVHTVEDLIARENETFARRDNARSALTKIRVDDDLIDYLRLQKLRLSTVIESGSKVFLRRVANISAGGVSINVTNEIHPDNRKLAQDVASFLKVHCLGVDVLADDISKSWRESPLAIIEINAGPGVFMHMVPAIGESIDVPGMIMRSHFPTARDSRIPIVVCDRLSPELRIAASAVLQTDDDLVVASASADGLFVKGEFFSRKSQWLQVAAMLRHQSVDAALVEYREDDIVADGLRYAGADVACLFDPTPVERVLARDLEEDGWLLVRSDGWPLECPARGITVILLDPSKSLTAVPEGVQGVAQLKRNKPVMLVGDEVRPLPDPDRSLPADERLAAACLADIAPVLMARYYPAG
ncbi:ATP-grasp domain-containing protein [Candidatus Fermentibacteria bacterium]|nr:ATP-grasp domain-containing protein [Candidatus Fermentibacteria bacterium]